MQTRPGRAVPIRVQNIETLVKSLTGKDVSFERFDGLTQDDLGIWNSPGGARIAWFKDPDGHILSVTE